MKKKERIQKIVVLAIAALVIGIIAYSSISANRKNLALRAELQAGSYDLSNPYAANIAYEDYLKEHGGLPAYAADAAGEAIPRTVRFDDLERNEIMARSVFAALDLAADYLLHRPHEP